MRPETLALREGPSVREFLRYYVPVLLQEGQMTPDDMRAAIQRQSSENRDVRPSGPLVISARDLRLVLRQLRKRGLIRQSGAAWVLTGLGRKKASGCEKQKEAKPNSKERAAGKLLELMGRPRPGETVLDVGTGEGFMAFKLADRGYRVVGIDSGSFDYSKDSLRAAIEKAGSHDGQVEFRKAAAAEIAQTGERFDYVVTSQAMHCMKDQWQCLAAIHRLLKPDGTFLCMDFAVGLEGFLRHGWHSFLAIPREEWQRVLPQCGFREVTCRKAGDYLVVRARKRHGYGEGARRKQTIRRNDHGR
jgi:ubiquinone/menaquinone biosynthesis C-methylase UbiE